VNPELAPTRIDRLAVSECSAQDLVVMGESKLAAARPKALELLGPSQVPIGKLLHQSRLTPALPLTILLEVDLAGNLERHVGGQISLIESM